MVSDESLKTLAEDGCQSNGPPHVILFFFSMGTMVDFWKHEGTTDRERVRLKMSVKTPASWNAHARSTRPGMPSGPTTFRMFTHSGYISDKKGVD